MKRFIGVFTMSHENKGVRALPPETFETGERFRTPFLVCEDKNTCSSIHFGPWRALQATPLARGFGLHMIS